MRGDALKVLKSLPSESVDLLLTDPPYGDNIGYGTKNTRISGNEHPLLALSAIYEAYRVLKPNRSAYVFFGLKHYPLIHSFIAAYTKYRIRDVLVWDKVIQGRGHGFRRRYESILVLEKGASRYRRPGMPNVLSFKRVTNGLVRTGVGSDDTSVCAEGARHPHEKPLDLLRLLIEQSTDRDDVVLDPFVGSGTTAVAAALTGRNFIAAEIDANYFRSAQQRVAETWKTVPSQTQIR